MLSKEATLYTEMIHCDTVLKCKDREGLLSFDTIEKPVVFQFGGSDPSHLA